MILLLQTVVSRFEINSNFQHICCKFFRMCHSSPRLRFRQISAHFALKSDFLIFKPFYIVQRKYFQPSKVRRHNKSYISSVSQETFQDGNLLINLSNLETAIKVCPSYTRHSKRQSRQHLSLFDLGKIYRNEMIFIKEGCIGLVVDTA